MRKTIKKEIFLDHLPKYKYNNRISIDWDNSIKMKIRFVYGNIVGELEIVGYNKENRHLIINYNDKTNYEIHVNHLKNCKLGYIVGVKTNEFKIEVGTHYKDDKRDLVITDREYREKEKNSKDKKYIENKKWYKYTCNKCGWTEGYIEESDILNGRGCSCCRGFDVVQGINDIPTTAPFMVKYFQGGYDEAKLYTRSSSQEIFPICSDCGRVKNSKTNIYSIYKRKSIGCPYCGDGFSYPEKFMSQVLDQLNIKFITQYSPDWIKPKRYDFYFELNSKKYIVETDGGLGHGKGVHSKSDKTKEETLSEDDYKNLMADEHGIEVIRVECDKSDMEYIKGKILDSKLSELFDISNINWLKCEEFALSNRVKEACILKKDNPNMFASDIAKIMNLDSSTISKYLKKGSKIWDWCNYDTKEEMRSNNKRNGVRLKELNIKQVEIFKDGVSLGIFKSATELEMRSEELFGVKFHISKISNVCNGKRKSHKGFTFKYVS